MFYLNISLNPNHVKWFLRIFLGLFFFLFPLFFLSAQSGNKINILNANDFTYNRAQGDIRKLIGDVRMEHAGTYMNCDSAYLYQISNEVEAFGHIYIRQGDTLHLYGDYLHYTGDTRIAKLRENVRLINKETKLETDFLNYDLKLDQGYYYDLGEINSGDNFISSINGIYYSKEEIFHFQDSVEVINPDYRIYCDTMQYNTITEVTKFYGPTEIISDSNYIYCEKGWYDTKQDISRFSRNAIFQTQNELIRGDSLYYDRNNGIGEAYGNVIIKDSTQKVLLKGQIGYFHEKTDESMLTGDAVFIQIIEEGDSLFMHADTLRSAVDSLGINKIINAYYGVKIFQTDLQGICDSLSYSFADSVIRLYQSPLLWVEENQLSSEYMELHTKNNKPHNLDLIGSAFIISQEDSLKFNQIKGKNMTAYFKNEVLHKIMVSGNAQAIYYLKDEDDGETIGVNKSESSYITLYLKDKEIHKIILINQIDGVLNPEGEITPDESKLESFVWKEYLRPKKMGDIFK